MKTTVNFPALIQGVGAGPSFQRRDTPRRYWSALPVEIEEISPRTVERKVSVESVLGRVIVPKYYMNEDKDDNVRSACFSINGEGTFSRVPVDVLDEEDEFRDAYWRFFGLDRYQGKRMLRQRPDMSFVDKDSRSKDEAHILAAAAGMKIAGKNLLTPVHEPFLRVIVDMNGLYGGTALCVDTLPIRTPSAFFRINQLEEAMIFARRAGASEADVTRVWASFKIDVADNAQISFDAAGYNLAVLAGSMLAAVKDGLLDMSKTKVINWVELRDALAIWAPNADQTDQLVDRMLDVRRSIPESVEADFEFLVDYAIESYRRQDPLAGLNSNYRWS